MPYIMTNLEPKNLKLFLHVLSEQQAGKLFGISWKQSQREIDKFMKTPSNFWKHPHETLPEVRYAITDIPDELHRTVQYYMNRAQPGHDVSTIKLPKGAASFDELSRRFGSKLQTIQVGQELGRKDWMVQEEPTAFDVAKVPVLPPKDITF